MTSKLLAGIDEVGRGSLAGPVVSVALILKNNIDDSQFVDSKAISESKRIKICKYIINNSLALGIGISTNQEIDKINIHNATLLSMKRAIHNLSITPELIYIDGLYSPNVNISTECFVKGDQNIPIISAASIVAKVIRDNEMKFIHSKLNVYGFDKNKGYPTKEHKIALNIFGPCVHHRMSFAPLNT